MHKKPPASGCSCSSGVDSFAADELEVAGVLVRLSGLIRKSESARRLPSLWGAKRRRSVLDALRPPSDSPDLLLVTGKLDYASNSPNSPLVFSSHADFDSNHAVPNKNSIKKGKVMELLTGDQLVTENMKMQDTRQLCVSSNSVSLELKLFSKPEPLDPHRQQESQMGPMGMIPDLNVPAEVYAAELGCPLQLHHQTEYRNYQVHHQYQVIAAAKSRAEAAALARQRRHLIQKSKKATRGRR